MLTPSPHRTGRVLRLLFAAGLAFNLVWLAIAPLAGMFHEHLFLRSDSLREMAYQYYGERRPDRFVGTALYDLYGPTTLIISTDMLSYLSLPISEPSEDLRLRGGRIRVQVTDDLPVYTLPDPSGVYEAYVIGPEAREVGFLVPQATEAQWNRVIALREGERILFIPLAGDDG